MSSHILKIFLPSGSQTILVFLYWLSWQYSDRDRPNKGVKCRWGRHKSRLSERVPEPRNR